MPLTIEKLPGESIIIGTFGEPFVPGQDISALFTEVIRQRSKMRGPVALVMNLGPICAKSDELSRMITALSHAAAGIRASQFAGIDGPPYLFFIGSGPIVELIAKAISQPQYGGTYGRVCASQEEALASAREALATHAAS